MEDTNLEVATAQVAAEEIADEGSVSPTEAPEAEEQIPAEEADYETVARADLDALKAQFPALSALTSLAELPDPARYGELRELGLTPREAYLAIGGAPKRKSDNRSHLFSSVPRTSAHGRDLPTSEQMAEARRLFTDLNDAQIHRLYKKVTG